MAGKSGKLCINIYLLGIVERNRGYRKLVAA